MAKFYSSLFILLVFFPCVLSAQNVGVGTSDPREKLEVAGAVIIGTTTADIPGTIRFNPSAGSDGKFEGRDSTGWVPFGGGSGESLWKKNGINIYPDTPQYSGNVGIGTIVPLAKLHVKGNGNIAIRAETANDTLPALDVINTTGVAVKAKADHDSLWAIEAINLDSSGYAIKLINAQAQDTVNGDIVPREGGNAALLVGDMNLWGALRNSDSTLYGGSVAINDGLTVGDIAGASCTPETDTSAAFNHDFGASFEVIYHGLGNNEVYTNLIADDTSNDCRTITKVYVEAKVGDDESFPLEFEVYLRGQYIFGIPNEPSANLSNYMPLPTAYPAGYYISGSNAYESSLCGCYTSRWGWNVSAPFAGQDPNDIDINFNNDWYTQFNSNSYVAPDYDGDYLFAYSGTVHYKWGDTIQAPAYATYGDIRASGSVYANSDDLLGDVAEYFKVFSMGRQPEAGDIVSISKKDPQTFELSSAAYDPLLVGVVSEKPSVHLNNPKSGYPIGLTGRVKVKVNLMGGKIGVGDPVTSSSVEGIGMKASGNGTIVGYALEAYDGSRVEKGYGYIIILLARGHVEKLSPDVKVEEINAPTYGGTLVKGSMKVMNDEKTVFIPWGASLAQDMPSDVEFDDLFVELTPFGGNAELIVKDVNVEGITVEIINKSDGFKGFYYKTDIVTSMAASPGSNVGQDVSAGRESEYSYEERVSKATELYKEWAAAGKALQKKGMSLAPIRTMTSGKQASLYKKEVVASWQRNAPELFAQWQNLGRELSQVVNDDQSIMEKARGAN